MVDFTFLEVHFEDANLTANAPYSHGETEEAPGEGPTADEPGSRRGAIFALFAGLIFSVAVAYLVRKKIRGVDEEDLSVF